ncbi:MAG TPA: EamA family transporter [Pyrinomonadaceae bacterium]|nr:EamA family transporter [Pyrinomonadaceae bacterium]
MTPTRTESAPRPARAAIILAFATVYIVWGSTYLGIRYAIETLPPFLMAGTRFMTAGAILFVWAKLNGDSVASPLSQWRRAFFIGGLLLLCGNGGVTWAEKYIPSSLAALLVATEPLWVVMLNWGFGGKRPNWKVSLGVFLGLAGVALLVGTGLNNGSHVSPIMLAASGVVVLAGMAWAGGSVYASRSPIKASTSLGAGMQMLAGGSLLVLLSLVTGDFKLLNLGAASWRSLAAFGYLLVFGSLLGFTAYSWLLRKVTPASAATYAYVNPAVAVLLGWFFASEPLTLRMLMAGAVIVCSVILITTFGAEHAAPAASSVHDSECPTPPCA